MLTIKQLYTALHRTVRTAEIIIRVFLNTIDALFKSLCIHKRHCERQLLPSFGHVNLLPSGRQKFPP